MDKNNRPMKPLSRWAMFLASVCFVAYAVNVLIGKAVVSFQWTTPRLGDVAEFLLVLAGVVLFVFALIADEMTSDTSARTH
jgi:hypothetical protein